MKMETIKNRSVRWPFEADHSFYQQSELIEQLMPDYLALLQAENIPVNQQLKELYANLYLPFSHWVSQLQNTNPLVVGINGSQGSGKSTLTKIIKLILEKGFNKTVVALSIDDLYKTRQQRLKMAEDIHPLFTTRGVPGTHDMKLAGDIFSHLLNRNDGVLTLPVFDKAIDDRLDENDCHCFEGHCDIVLFEGWCVGAAAQDVNLLKEPVNQLEKTEDPDGRWRHYVNTQLGNDYKQLFANIDIQVLLKIPDFSKVFEWRSLQEQKLKNNLTKEDAKSANKTMSENEIQRFIMHYERITRHTLNEMPDRCDVVFELGDDHLIKKVITRQNE